MVPDRFDRLSAALDDTVVRAPRPAEVVADVLEGDTVPVGARPAAVTAPTIPIELLPP